MNSLVLNSPTSQSALFILDLMHPVIFVSQGFIKQSLPASQHVWSPFSPFGLEYDIRLKTILTFAETA